MFRESLRVADQLRAETLAFPAIGAGVYGWDAETVARRGIGQVLEYDGGVQVVEFVLFSAGLAETFRRVHLELWVSLHRPPGSRRRESFLSR